MCRRRPDARKRSCVTAAIDHLTKILDTPAVATDLNLQLTLARLHLRAGRAERAVPILENIVAQAPFATEPYTLLAEARLALGRVDAAIEAMQRGRGAEPAALRSAGRTVRAAGALGGRGDAYEQAVANGRGGRAATCACAGPRRSSTCRDGQGAAKARDVLKDFLMTSPQDARGAVPVVERQLCRPAISPAPKRSRASCSRSIPTSIPGLHALSAALVGRRQSTGGRRSADAVLEERHGARQGSRERRRAAARAAGARALASLASTTRRSRL